MTRVPATCACRMRSAEHNGSTFVATFAAGMQSDTDLTMARLNAPNPVDEAVDERACGIHSGMGGHSVNET